jgi:tetratricopeptide (TPR) repeat protein
VKDTTKKLTLFIIIFAVAALILYMVMPSAKLVVKPNMADSSATVMIPDSTIDRMLGEISQLKAKASKNPTSAEPLIQIGNHYFDINKPDEAISYYEKALIIDPSNPFVLTDCAAMYEHLGNADKALEYIDMALSLKPDLPQAYFNRGLALFHHKNDKQGAIVALQKFIDLIGDSSQANIAKQQIAIIQGSQ